MQVKLLNKIDLQSAIIGAGVCVGKSVEQASIKGLISAVEQGHLSVLEHVWLSFYIEGISRACSHQLVRHRHCSFLQQSQRYCKVGEGYVYPDGLSIGQEQLYADALVTATETYEQLIKLGVNKEDARMVLPNATATKLVMSCNLRTFIEMAQKRLCVTAQKEIHDLFIVMKSEMLKAINDACDEDTYGIDENRRFYYAVADLTKPDCKNCKEKRGCKRDA